MITKIIVRFISSILFLLSFTFCSQHTSEYQKDGWRVSAHHNVDRFHEIIHKNLYEAGPTGWMLEWEYDGFETSVLIFCEDSIFHQTLNNSEFDGKWFLDNDSIRVQITKQTSEVGIGKPIPWEGEMNFKTFFQYKSYKEVVKIVDFHKSFSWKSITESVFNENEAPFKLISIYSECGTELVLKDSLNSSAG